MAAPGRLQPPQVSIFVKTWGGCSLPIPTSAPRICPLSSVYVHNFRRISAKSAFVPKNDQISFWAIFASFLRFFANFWCKRKLRFHTFQIKSFLPHSLVFYLTFVTSKVEHIWVVNMKSEQTSRLKKWGKKLVRGVKNFWIFSKSISVFIFKKNHSKNLKTHENKFLWNKFIFKIFFLTFFQFFKISNF